LIELKEPSEHEPSLSDVAVQARPLRGEPAGLRSDAIGRSRCVRPSVSRGHECEVLDRLLGAGRGGVLVVHGEAWVGKTVLIEYAVAAGRKFRVARTIGIEADMELPFAAAQQSCAPLLNLSDHLPQHQHEALSVAFGVSAGPAPSPYLVRLALQACCRKRQSNGRSSQLLTTHIGWTKHRRERFRSWLAVCWRSRSR